MFKNYFKTTLRNLRRNKIYASINIGGLSIGIACSLIVFLYVQDELSFDRFNKHAESIVRVDTQISMGGSVIHVYPPAPLGPTLVDELGGIVNSARISSRSRVVISSDRGQIYEENFAFADPSLFEIFDFNLELGSAKTALRDPFSMIVSKEIAQKYFGYSSPIGKTLVVDDTLYTISGVLREAAGNSHLRFNFVASFETLARLGTDLKGWNPGVAATYLLLDDNYPRELLSEDIFNTAEKYLGEREGITFNTIDLLDIHLHSGWNLPGEVSGDIRYIYIFSFIGVLILIIACVNYMNLATAQAGKRSREIGVRKVVGALRLQVMRLFLSESFIFTSIAVVLALGLIELFLPAFNSLVNKQLRVAYFEDLFFLPALAGLVVLVALASGGYPAFYLSSFRPSAILKGGHVFHKDKRTPHLRNSLVVFQFAISIALIFATITIYSQLEYIQNKRLGFNKDQVMVINPKNELGERYAAFKSELLRYAFVQGVTTAPMPGSGATMPVTPEGLDKEKGHISANVFWIDEDFLRLAEIELVEGRNLSEKWIADLDGAVLINEAATDAFGWSDALGKTIRRVSDDFKFVESRVVGVVKNFHYESLKRQIAPLILQLTKKHPQNILVKIDGTNISTALKGIEQAWQAFSPKEPFEYSFLDAGFERMYRAEKRVSKFFLYCAALAICIACLGLLGLASFTTERRTKEIGIRKVLGATIHSVVNLLAKDFVKLVLLANLIAWPIAFFAMNRWLQDFAYRIEIGWGVFLLAGGLALLIALVTVSTQAIRAALANPVEALRYE